MSQPNWTKIENLGDVNPVEYGGFIVLKDTTGVYSPEVVVMESLDSLEEPITVSRICLEKCYPIGEGQVSDNKFHKADPAWFSDELESVASLMGITVKELISNLTSNDEIERANGYYCLVGYFGTFAFDQYPREMSYEEATEFWENL